MTKKHTQAEYVAPCIEVLDVVSEAVFCTSTNRNGIYDWQDDEEALDFMGF